MKAAFWGIALIVLGVLGIVLIDLFGNIAVTNQLNYTTMKNAVEASMLDAVSQKYLKGFCLCTDVEQKSGKFNFKNKSEYELKDISYTSGKENCSSSKKYCYLVKGDRRIDKQVFAESFTRRFAEMVNNTKNYEIVFQEIIEYPPKVSVQVNSKDDEFLPTDRQNGFTIVNQMDSIIETNAKAKTILVKPTPTPPSSSGGSSSGGSSSGGGGNCSWHHNKITVSCTRQNGYGRKTATVDAKSGYSSCAAAKNDCVNKAKNACGTGWVADSYSCEGYQSWSTTCQTKSGYQYSRSWSNSCSNSTTCSKTCGSNSSISCKCSG